MALQDKSRSTASPQTREIRYLRRARTQALPRPIFGPPSIATVGRGFSSKRTRVGSAADFGRPAPQQLPQREGGQGPEPLPLKAAGATGLTQGRPDGGRARRS